MCKTGAKLYKNERKAKFWSSEYKKNIFLMIHDKILYGQILFALSHIHNDFDEDKAIIVCYKTPNKMRSNVRIMVTQNKHSGL